MAIPPIFSIESDLPAVDPTYRINIHFQPELAFQSTTVIESLASSKRYYSQYKTGISNGGLLANSARHAWELSLFGDFYENSDLERPKYGSLNITGDDYGASPRFGPCYFRLKPEVLNRTTFCFPDSYYGVAARGTAKHFNLDLVAHATTMEDPLDWYIEAHVHGPLSLPEDVEALVLDPCYRNSKVSVAAAMLDCPIEWHRGYRMHISELENFPEYRGRQYVDVASRLVGVDGMLKASLIKGDVDSPFDQQQLKRVWHYLARFGRLKPRSPLPEEATSEQPKYACGK